MRIFRSLQWRLWLAFSAIILTTLLFLGLAFGAQAQRLAEVVLYTRLEEQARTLLPLLAQRIEQQGNGEEALQRLLIQPVPRGGNRPRLLLVTRDGRVVYDAAPPSLPSQRGKKIARWHLVRQGPMSYRGEFTDEMNKRWLVAGVPLRRRQNASPWVLAVAAPASDNAVLTQIGRTLLLSGLIALLAGLGVALLAARWLGHPIRDISRATQAIAQGNLDVRLDPEQVPTEFVPLIENFNAMVEEVKRARQSQRNLVANVSHDLKTPITSIRGFAQALKEGVVQDEDARRRAADVIYEEAERMHRMVNQLLELAKMDAGQLRLNKHPLDLAALVRHQVEVAQMRAREKGITLETDLKVPSLPVLGDEDRLAQILTNLLENALTHTPSGGSIRVEGAVETDGTGKEWVVLHVVDTGKGIPEEDIPHIFERFYRGDKSRSGRQGSGLGLAIVKELVEAHGGHIKVQSVVGLGTRFTIYFPARSEPPAP